MGRPYKRSWTLNDKIKKNNLCECGTLITPESTRCRSCEGKRRLVPGGWNKGLKVLSLSGENHWNWQGGKTKVQKAVRNSMEYKKWRTTIFERDNYLCQMCGIKGTRLNVDHWPKPFSLLVKENNIQSLEDAVNCDALWDVENNRTLCENCHRTTFIGNQYKPVWSYT